MPPKSTSAKPTTGGKTTATAAAKAPAGKAPAKAPASKASKEKKAGDKPKRRKIRKETYSSYIYKVLKQVNILFHFYVINSGLGYFRAIIIFAVYFIV